MNRTISEFAMNGHGFTLPRLTEPYFIFFLCKRQWNWNIAQNWLTFTAMQNRFIFFLHSTNSFAKSWNVSEKKNSSVFRANEANAMFKRRKKNIFIGFSISLVITIIIFITNIRNGVKFTGDYTPTPKHSIRESNNVGLINKVALE